MIQKITTSRADISRNYLKRLFPTISQRVYYINNIENLSLHEEYVELNTALMLFSLRQFELHNILYDSFISKRPLTIRELATKYNYSMRTIDRRKQQALEEFYLFVPTKYR